MYIALVPLCVAFAPQPLLPRTLASPRLAVRAAVAESEEVDFVVVGSGIGGLSCAGLLARVCMQLCMRNSNSPMRTPPQRAPRGAFRTERKTSTRQVAKVQDHTANPAPREESLPTRVRSQHGQPR